ncbi:hypothetical protein D3C85_1236540 [compost metagenome]
MRAGFKLEKGFFQGSLSVFLGAVFLEDEQAGKDGVYPDRGGVFLGERQHHVLQRRFGSGISDMAFAASRRGFIADMDNVGSFQSLQMCPQLQIQMIGRFDMEFEHGVQVFEAIVQPQRGVVDHCSQAVEVGLDVGNQRFAIALAFKVRLERQHIWVQ